MRERTLAAAFVAASATAALADDLQVPREYHLIELAADAAKPGDRIVVTGGRYGNVQIRRSDVTIVGRGATLASNVWIDGSRVTLSGFRIEASGRRDVGVIVTGDDVVVADNRFVGGDPALSTPVMVKTGTGTRIEGNRFSASGIFVSRADGVVVRSNRVRAGKIRIYSDDATVESNTGPLIEMGGREIVARGNHAGEIRTSQDGGTLEDNVVTGTLAVQGSGNSITGNRLDGGGIQVTGDDTSIRRNSVRRSRSGVVVFGERADVGENVIELAASGRQRDFVGVSVRGEGPGSAIVGNRVDHAYGNGIEVRFRGSIVANNVVHGTGPSASISVDGSENQVSGNEVSHTNGAAGVSRGIEIRGGRNEVGGNSVSGDFTEGIAIDEGAGNIVTDDEVSGARRSGIVVAATAPATDVSLCTVSACRVGLTNRNADTALRGSTLQGNRSADILDVAGFRVFDGNAVDVISHDERILSR